MKVYPSLTINAASEPTVSQGSTGNAVVQLQEALANAGFSPGAADGDFGPATRAALVRFQAANGLSQDGVAGPNTWAALARANNGAPSAPAPSAGASGEPTLSKGSSGSAVTTLQEDLNKDGFSTGGVDGVFGNNTLNAVEAFQRSRGLSVDGVVGANTWSALSGAAPSSPSKPTSGTSGSEPTVYSGSSGPAVSTLQTLLTNLGYSTDGIDGSFGAHTLAALQSFQRSHGLTDDGICGPATWAALQSAKPGTTTAPPPSSSGGSEPTVQNGATGAAVTKLQQLLTAAGFSTGGVDGNFGPNTLSAVMSYQYSRGLSVDGVVGPNTWNDLLNNAPATRSAPPPGSVNGSTANQVAQRFLGDAEHSLEFSGDLPMDTWVPTSEDCANFVSACLQAAGLIPGSQHSDNVVGLKNNLLADGWSNTFNGSPTGVPLADAKPGDVVCFDGPGGSFQHVEIFNGFVNGQPQYIGSNNILSDGTQEISTDNGSWAYTVHIYAPPA